MGLSAVLGRQRRPSPPLVSAVPLAVPLANPLAVLLLVEAAAEAAAEAVAAETPALSARRP